MISQKAARVSGPMANSLREETPAVDDRTIGGDFDSQVQRVDPRQPLVEQAAYRRIAGCGRILDDAGAVDDGIDFKALKRSLAAPAISDGRAGSVRRNINNLGCPEGQSTVHDRLQYRGLDLGRHAMPMDIPPCAGVFEETPSGIDREFAPEALRKRSQSVHDTAPVTALRGMAIDEMSQPVQQLAGAGAKGYLRLVNGQRRHAAMRLRHQPAARHGDDWPSMAVAQQRQYVVCHGQTRSEDENQAVFPDPRGGRWRPGISITSSRQLPGVVSRCQNGEVACKLRAARQFDHDAVGVFADRGAFAVQYPQAIGGVPA